MSSLGKHLNKLKYFLILLFFYQTFSFSQSDYFSITEDYKDYLLKKFGIGKFISTYDYSENYVGKKITFKRKGHEYYYIRDKEKSEVGIIFSEVNTKLTCKEEKPYLDKKRNLIFEISKCLDF